jgi:hypothetical protein
LNLENFRFGPVCSHTISSLVTEQSCLSTKNSSSAPARRKVETKFTTNVFRCFLGIAASILLVGQPAYAETSWGSIGGGWKSLGSQATETPVDIEPAPASLRATAATRSQAIPFPAASTAALSAPTGVEGNRALTRAVGTRYASHAIVKNAGIDPREFMIFFEVMIETESAMRDTAVSSVGAIGLAQLMPGTARELGVNPHDRAQNLDGGARYLLAQIQEFGTLSLAVAAYNAGPGAVRQYGGVPRYRETERHVSMVMSHYERRWRLISSQE